MGSPILASAANLVMQHVEETEFGSIPFNVNFYFRHVDDNFKIWNYEHVESIHKALNDVDQTIQFLGKFNWITAFIFSTLPSSAFTVEVWALVYLGNSARVIIILTWFLITPLNISGLTQTRYPA